MVYFTCSALLSMGSSAGWSTSTGNLLPRALLPFFTSHLRPFCFLLNQLPPIPRSFPWAACPVCVGS